MDGVGGCTGVVLSSDVLFIPQAGTRRGRTSGERTTMSSAAGDGRSNSSQNARMFRNHGRVVMLWIAKSRRRINFLLVAHPP